jgi:hypothetical protein
VTFGCRIIEDATGKQSTRVVSCFIVINPLLVELALDGIE